MVHINYFEIENFRIFRKKHGFNLKPITILTGTNSSGKSSLNKAILMFKESYLSNNLRQVEMNIPYLKLGGLDQNLSEKNRDFLDIKIGFNKFAPRGGSDFQINVKSSEIPPSYCLQIEFDKRGAKHCEFWKNDDSIFSWRNNSGNEDGDYITDVVWKLAAAIIYNKAKSKEVEDAIGSELFAALQKDIGVFIQGKVCCDEFSINERDFFKVWDVVADSIKSIHDDTISFVFSDADGIPHIGVQGELPRIREVVSEVLGGKLPKGVLDLFIYELVESIKLPQDDPEVLRPVLEQVHYIPGVRARQEIVYTIEEYPLLCKVLTNYHEYVKGGAIINLVGVNGVREVVKPKYAFLERWLVKEFNIVKKLEDLVVVSIDGYGIQVKVNDNQTLNQVGYGFVQLLPIIIQIVFMDKLVFIIEEPESNLHPEVQSKLADFFVDAVREFKCQFIIETHSEYLIRKLQTVVAEGTLPREDANCYYFYNPERVPEGAEQIYEMTFCEDGSLSRHFGKGFFDEVSLLNIALYNKAKSNSN